MSAKDRVSNVFDAPAEEVFEIVYRYFQHHGTIKFSDDKHQTLSGVIFLGGGKWDYTKAFDCTVSVEELENGRSAVNVIGTYPSQQRSLIGMFKEGPYVRVLRGIREDFERRAIRKSAARPEPTARIAETSQDAKTEIVQAHVPAQSVQAERSKPVEEEIQATASIGAWSDENPVVRHDGVSISGVTPAGPSDQIGLRPGDVILSLDNRYVFTVNELLAEMKRHKPGEKLAIRYRRNTSINDSYVVLSRTTNF